MRKARTSTEAAVAREITKPDERWRDELTPLQYSVLRQAHTERPFTGEFVHNHEDGFYRCAGCGAKLFSSDAKFDSGTGWPTTLSRGGRRDGHAQADRRPRMVAAASVALRRG